jgi:hypothetical protein
MDRTMLMDPADEMLLGQPAVRTGYTMWFNKRTRRHDAGGTACALLAIGSARLGAHGSEAEDRE